MQSIMTAQQAMRNFFDHTILATARGGSYTSLSGGHFSVSSV